MYGRMVYEIVQLFVGILTAGLVAAVVAGWFVYRFQRRCTNLEWAIGDLQQRASTFKGKEMAEKRWDKQKTMEAELASLGITAPPQKRRYDNDPLGE